MISDITFNNYRLFKGQDSLSFVADARTKKLLSNSYELDSKNILKSLAIYGPNNSGKSNLFHLFGIIKSILLGRNNFECNRPIFSDVPISSFSITYNNMDQKGWIRYEFSYDSINKKFVREKLSTIKYYAKGTSFERVIFEKDSENKILKIFDIDNSQFLSIIPSTNPILYSIELGEGQFHPLLEWRDSLQTLANSIDLIQMYNIPIENTISSLKGTDTKKKRFIGAFVKDCDISVNNFEYKKDVHFAKDGQVIDERALYGYESLLDSLHLSTTYGNKQVPSLFFDSSGTKKMEALASYIYDSIKDGKLLVVDELDNGLHFRLTRAIVSAFNNMANGKGQILFTAHDLMLIDCKMLLRKDQIYFLERTNDKASLFCLKDAPVSEGGPREGSDLIKKYNKGEFGALPFPSFIKELFDINVKGDDK